MQNDAQRASLAAADAVPAAKPAPSLVRALLKALAYYLYERRLYRGVAKGAMPRHVGIILDGNRRYGRRMGITDPVALYRNGADKLDDVLSWCDELRIGTVTLWVCSTDNLARGEAELSGIFAAVEAKLAELAEAPEVHRRRVRVRAIGQLSRVPDSTLKAIRQTEEATRGYDSLALNIAIAYGGRQEIVDAVIEFLRDAEARGAGLKEAMERLDPASLEPYLYTAGSPDPDLIIRTSGEVRLSGFLLWQSVHSEFYVSDVYWPAFRKIDFLRAIRAYQERHRRYGL
ncbi:MAG: polyprenyl diphosphate synthase [Stellaceae bacterium]